MLNILSAILFRKNNQNVNTILRINYIFYNRQIQKCNPKLKETEFVCPRAGFQIIRLSVPASSK